MPERCTVGIWDDTLPGIEFDRDGVSNYCRILRRFASQYPRGDAGRRQWEERVANMRADGRNKRYDCVVGVSGGTDSSYLLHVTRQLGLRPLAVTLDNGWSSDISVSNIKLMTDALEVDLETHVIEYEEMKDVLVSYMRAGMPWIDFPTDHAIKSLLYRTARREGLSHVLIGHDFRSEGLQPSEWTYGDAKQLRHIHATFGSTKLRTFPTISYFHQVYLGYLRGVKMVYPYYFIDYNKTEARNLLEQEYGWRDYGGHHHENTFTKFAIAYWLPKKFGIDKRIVTLSAQVLNGQLSRDEALEQLAKPPYDPLRMERDKEYTLKKLDLSDDEFLSIWNAENRGIYDYPSYKSLTEKYARLLLPVVRRVLPQMPGYFVQLEVRGESA